MLIDEYDVPLDKAYQNGYYPQMVQLIRSVFSQALKSNKSLYFAVITGCLRIAKESIFTGLNTFKVRTIADLSYAEYFEFTDKEVREMLSYYELEDKFSQMKEWYDGYRFGQVDIYCFLDILNQCDKFLESRSAPMLSLPTNLIGGKMGDYFNKKLNIVFLDLISVVCYIICAVIPFSAKSIVLMFITATCQNMEHPSYNALTADMTKTEDRERAYSLQYLCTNLGFVMAPAVGAFFFGIICGWHF